MLEPEKQVENQFFLNWKFYKVSDCEIKFLTSDFGIEIHQRVRFCIKVFPDNQVLNC